MSFYGALLSRGELEKPYPQSVYNDKKLIILYQRYFFLV